jgi:alpha-1,2-rhamnosyltransferase
MKLYIDCTATFYSNSNTGIQRTTRKIIEEKQYFDKGKFGQVYSVIGYSGDYYYLPDFTFYPCFTSALYSFGAKLRNLLDSRHVTFKNDHNKDVSILRCNWLNFLRDIHLRSFKITQFLDLYFSKLQRVDFQKDNVLFIPDSFWDPLFSFDALNNARKSNCDIVLFIHDIFPITHPEFVSSRTLEMFERKFEIILPLIDGYICNSNMTLSDVRKYIIKQHNEYNSLPATYVHLGSDIFRVAMKPLRKSVVCDIQDYYLMVGTIEPRKNHNFVLDAFENLWSAGYAYPLVIVGRVGWKCHQTIDRVKSSKYYNNFLFMYNESSDQELVSFYHYCRAVIMSSFVEGYGLPLVEAVQHNKPVFASHIPIFREVGQNYPFYFDLQDPMTLVDLIRKFESGALSSEAGEIPHIVTWKECTENLCNALHKMCFSDS